MVLVDVYRFEEWEKFQTDLREVFGFIQSSVDKDKMKQFLKKYEKDLGVMSEDACEMIESITGTANIRKFRMRQKEEKNMCKAIDDMMQEKYEEGREYERMNTERERRRADELVKKISELENENRLLKQKIGIAM